MNLQLVAISLVICFTSTFSSSKAATCGYEYCPTGKPGVINVHVVPHTHDDVGWLKTIDQYYYGASTFYQRAGVQYIIDSVIRELQKSPERRFIYVEMAFFWQWWEEQTEETKTLVKQLVEEGRLEFINGGWCMNDEATTHYNDIVDQMTWGLRFLNDTFGECGRPRIAWQIDPFGHAREQASLFALMGYDGLFFARLDWVDKDKRLVNKEMEMIWEASNSLGDRGSIFTGALYDHYGPPSGFCFDVLCDDSPIMDNPLSPEYNVPEKIGGLINYTKLQASRYATNHIMFTMGSDFHYMSGNMWFKNIDKMIKHANEMDPTINMFYSTPSCYLKALNDAGITWPRKIDDFFPYSNDPHAYWTGYFTSRPAIKGMVRRTNTLLQTCKQLHSLSGQSLQDQEAIDSLRRAMAVAQHHDAVAGTEKQHVANDYALRLHEATMACQMDVSNSLNLLLRIGNQPLPEQTFCLQLNISECDVTENGYKYVVTIYNPRSQLVSKYIRLPVTNGVFSVLDPSGRALVTQLVPIPSFIRSIKERASIATHDLVFWAENIPPLGHKSFFVQKSAFKKHHYKKTRSGDSFHRSVHQHRSNVWVPSIGQKAAISNERISVSFGTNGLIESVTVDGQTTPLSQNLFWYPGMAGRNNGFNDRASGAYVFRPNGTDAIPISQQATVIVQTGPLVEEVHQIFSDWAAQVVRIYKGDGHVQMEWTVGPIPVDDMVGKEIVSRVSSNFVTNKEFYTDSNGRQTLKRIRDFRPTWTLDVTEPVAGNYYPVNSHLYMTNSDSSQLIALVTDRSQGGTSLHDGEIELMIHRRLLYDDAFGVGEALNETANGQGLTVTGTHYLVVLPKLTSHPVAVLRPLTLDMFMAPWLTFSHTSLTFNDWTSNYLTEKSGLTQPLPANVHLLTLEPWKDSWILRLEHVYDVNEDPILSQPVTIELNTLFNGYTIQSAEETVLGANQWMKDSHRLSWNNRNFTGTHQQNNKALVTLQPMEIKTWIIQLVK